MPRILPFLTGFLISIFLGTSIAGAFFCGSSIIQPGDTAEYVLSCCGEPRSREPVSFRVKRGDRWEVVEGVREIWTYDFGSTAFVQRLTFDHGVLTEIVQGEYGED
ncbi:MAG: DUF2845 domain-containing protein [Deltaproteobacteria bacterium]|nr:DUF2845 domain-containing protein [Deltaproteobacteria bacterium]